jgi:hypothetical protein
MSYENDFQITAPAKAVASQIFGVLAISLASAGIAHAAQGMTREQVQAQLIAAERTGNIVEPWTQEKLNELYPSEYQGKVANTANEPSRSQVTAREEAAVGADDLSQVIALKNE